MSPYPTSFSNSAAKTPQPPQDRPYPAQYTPTSPQALTKSYSAARVSARKSCKWKSAPPSPINSVCSPTACSAICGPNASKPTSTPSFACTPSANTNSNYGATAHKKSLSAASAPSTSTARAPPCKSPPTATTRKPAPSGTNTATTVRHCRRPSRLLTAQGSIICMRATRTATFSPSPGSSPRQNLPPNSRYSPPTSIGTPTTASAAAPIISTPTACRRPQWSTRA